MHLQLDGNRKDNVQFLISRFKPIDWFFRFAFFFVYHPVSECNVSRIIWLIREIFVWKLKFRTIFYYIFLKITVDF